MFSFPASKALIALCLTYSQHPSEDNPIVARLIEQLTKELNEQYPGSSFDLTPSWDWTNPDYITVEFYCIDVYGVSHKGKILIDMQSHLVITP